MTGLNACYVQDIANQIEQLARRDRRHLNGEAINDALIGLFHGQLKHADHRIHGRADFMAHGRQKSGLCPICLIGPLLGGIQLVDQLLAPRDDPLQVGNPGNRHQQQGSANGKALNDFIPIAQPETYDR